MLLSYGQDTVITFPMVGEKSADKNISITNLHRIIRCPPEEIDIWQGEKHIAGFVLLTGHINCRAAGIMGTVTSVE